MKKYRKRKNIDYDEVTNKRFSLFLGVILVVFGIVLFKIVQVMIIEKEDYKEKLASLSYTTILGSSSPRGRIYDRNLNVIVDNKSLKTITYKKEKGVSNADMIKLAYKVAPHLELNISRLDDRMKREFYFFKYPDKCDKLVTDKEVEKVELDN